MLGQRLSDLPTPLLLLDLPTLERNAGRMAQRAGALGLAFRPHVKTAKSMQVVQRMLGSAAPRITVSTLREAEYFLAGGIPDITYAVGIIPDRFERAARLLDAGARLTLVSDCPEVVGRLGRFARDTGRCFDLLIELDVGAHRAGLPVDGPDLLDLGRRIAADAGLRLAGVLTHGGHAYGCDGPEALRAVADREARDATRAAERLRQAGLACPVVSIGSSPAAHALGDPAGATELRAGVYVFNDLDQVELGCCGLGDIAVSVLASVIGHNRAAGRILLDAGTLALSKDAGLTTGVGRGYGLVCDPATLAPLEVGTLSAMSQEHGLIAVTDARAFDRLPVGAKVRILPNHACITSAAFDRYVVLAGQQVIGVWDRVNGW